MTSLKSQQKEIVNILSQAQNIFERLVSQSSSKAKEEFVGLYGKWVKENLNKAIAEIEALKVDKVIASRNERKSTSDIFENYIDRAVAAIKDTHGVKYSINELFKYKPDYSAQQITELGRITRQCDRALLRLKIFRSPALSIITSGWLWATIVIVAILSIPVYRYGWLYFQPIVEHQSTSQHEIIRQQVKSDIAVIQAQARAPEKSILERSSSTANAIWDLMSTIPKIISALAAAWSVILIWARR